MAGKRNYDDGCAAAHALDLIGERWALLVVRELMFGAKRFSDLRADLRTIAPNMLTQRLDGLCDAGIVVRRRLPPPAASWVYELTPWGRDLEPVLKELGRWAAHSPALPQGKPISAASIILSMRTLFDAVKTGDRSLYFRLVLNDAPYDVQVQGGRLAIERSDAPVAEDTPTLETTPQVLDTLLYEDADFAEAIEQGQVTLSGDRRIVQRFLGWFALPE